MKIVLFTFLILIFPITILSQNQIRSDTIMVSTVRLDSLIQRIDSEIQRLAEFEGQAREEQKRLRGILDGLMIARTDTTIHIRRQPKR